MVGTFNLEKDRHLERQLNGWPSNGNPSNSFHGVVGTLDTNLNENILHQPAPVPAWPDNDITPLSKDDLKDYEKKKSKQNIMNCCLQLMLLLK